MAQFSKDILVSDEEELVPAEYRLQEVSAYRTLMLQNSEELEIVGTDDETGLQGSSRTYIFSGNSLHGILKKSIVSLARGEMDPENYAFLLILVNRLLSDDWMPEREDRFRDIEVLRQLMSQHLNNEVNITDELRALVAGALPPLFDPMRGERFVPLGFIPGGVD